MTTARVAKMTKLIYEKPAMYWFFFLKEFQKKNMNYAVIC